MAKVIIDDEFQKVKGIYLKRIRIKSVMQVLAGTVLLRVFFSITELYKLYSVLNILWRDERNDDLFQMNLEVEINLFLWQFNILWHLVSNFV